jgi:hypothetical protein
MSTTQNFFRPGLSKAVRLVQMTTRRMARAHKAGRAVPVAKGTLANMQKAVIFIQEFGTASDKAAARSALRKAELALMTANRRRGSRRRSTRNRRRTTKNRRRTSRR